ncbi:hypothetical protein L7F22_016685 [Adiantum nelumboides]|nr:hypothetical protein [Adiantum nelumboides]
MAWLPATGFEPTAQTLSSPSFDIIKQKSLQLDTMVAQVFYYEHFEDLINFMTSGPILAMLLEQDNAIAKWRMLIGLTDPN